MSNPLRLRTSSDPRFSTLHREFEWGELDQNFISLLNLIETSGTDAFPSIAPYSPTFEYKPGELPAFVSFNDNIFENVSITPHTGVTPGTSEATWRHVSTGRLSHEQNTDFMLGRLSVLIGHTGTIDLRTPGLRNMNEFYVFNPSGTGEFTVNLRTAAIVRHMFTVQIAAGQNFNIRFANTADMYVGSEDAVLTPGHIAYFLGSAISPGGEMRTHLLFTTDQLQITNLSTALTTLSNNLRAMAYVDDAPNDSNVYSRGALSWIRGVAWSVYNTFVTWATNEIDLLKIAATNFTAHISNAQIHVPTPQGQVDGRILETQNNMLVYTDKPAADGGAGGHILQTPAGADLPARTKLRGMGGVLFENPAGQDFSTAQISFPGTGERVPTANAAGTVQAVRGVTQIMITDAALITFLTTTTWPANAVLSAPSGMTLRGEQGNEHIDISNGYHYKCYATGMWVRFPHVANRFNMYIQIDETNPTFAPIFVVGNWTARTYNLPLPAALRAGHRFANNEYVYEVFPYTTAVGSLLTLVRTTRY